MFHALIYVLCRRPCVLMKNVGKRKLIDQQIKAISERIYPIKHTKMIKFVIGQV